MIVNLKALGTNAYNYYAVYPIMELGLSSQFHTMIAITLLLYKKEIWIQTIRTTVKTWPDIWTILCYIISECSDWFTIVFFYE